MAVQEFDVRELRDGELVCVHDATFDRTTDAARIFGPGKQVAGCTLREVQQLDCGGGERVPTLEEALATMLPGALPLIEHKAGRADTYVDALRSGGFTERVVLQSFDWRFLLEVHEREPAIALGALGPNPYFPTAGTAALQQIAAFEPAILHWRADALAKAEVERAHAAGLLVFSYTTDDELGWLGGQAMGIDAMCTNDPAAMARVIDASGSGA